MEEIITVIRNPKSFCFNFDLPKDVDEYLKHEMLPHGSYSVSDIQDYIEYIIIKTRINNRLAC